MLRMPFHHSDTNMFFVICVIKVYFLLLTLIQILLAVNILFDSGGWRRGEMSNRKV